MAEIDLRPTSGVHQPTWWFTRQDVFEQVVRSDEVIE
jgi:hypothetical protein